ncbi:MAG: putative rane protein, partial [Frankiales bacterium]|nr:putative rane protein [Frankiales bacterium]
MTGQLPPDVVRRGRSGGWAPALRIARRELLRAKGRTLLVLLMVLLPVTGVVALDTLLRTADVRPAESLSRDLGTAQARITQDGAGPVLQSPDGSQQQSSATAAGASPPRVTEPELLAALPAGARLLPVVEGPVAQRVRTTDGRVARVTLVGVDLTDPSRRGPFALRTGRAPSTPDEVAVTASLARFGFPVGSTLRLPGGEPRTVTGTVAQPDSYGYTYAIYGSPAAVGVLGRPASRWYVHGPAVPWSSVQQVNALGGVVLSRAVVEDPPPDDQVPDLSGYTDHTTAALVG